MYLSTTFLCEFDAVVGDHLVDLAILVALALGVADEDDRLVVVRAN